MVGELGKKKKKNGVTFYARGTDGTRGLRGPRKMRCKNKQGIEDLCGRPLAPCTHSTCIC